MRILSPPPPIFSAFILMKKKKIMVVIPGLVIDLKRRIGHSITGSTSKSHGSIYELWVRNIASEMF
jgi:hypothetical protein